MSIHGFNLRDCGPFVSMYYQDIDDEFKIANVDKSYIESTCIRDGETVQRCPLLLGVWDILVTEFDRYYAVREIGGQTEYDFHNMLCTCLDRNADTFETQLEYYNEDVNKPIMGKTETTTFQTNDKLTQTYDSSTTLSNTASDEASGEDVGHNVDVPADDPEYDTDRSRSRTVYGKKTDSTSTSDNTFQSQGGTEDKRDGTQQTVISSLGIKPNVDYMNDYLKGNNTFIRFFLDTFEECFAPRYQRVAFETL